MATAPSKQPNLKTLEIQGDAQVIIHEDGSIKRTAGWTDIAYHSVTAMVGAGVLGLPAALAALGWAGGVIFLIFSFWVSWHTYKLLVYMHEVPDLDCKAGKGIRRLDRYDQLSQYVFGPRRGKAILLPFQLAVLIGIAITYNVAGGDNMAAFGAAVAPAGRVMSNWVYYIIFGLLQLLLSMLPSFDDLRINYNPAAVQKSSLERVMGIFSALTTILFAYGGHNVALEIQATIPAGGKYPSSTVGTMMKGVNITFVVTGLCYFGVSIVGFWAFGTGVLDNVLMAFANGPSHRVVSAAQLMVVIHVASAYQVYTQPIFSLMEGRIQKARGGAEVPVPLRCCVRLVYVALVTLVAILVPFFGALMGLIGAAAITPTTFLLPPLLWVLMKQPRKWGFDWTVNWVLVWITGLLGVLGAIGSLYIIIQSWSSYKLFAN